MFDVELCSGEDGHHSVAEKVYVIESLVGQKRKKYCFELLLHFDAPAAVGNRC